MKKILLYLLVISLFTLSCDPQIPEVPDNPLTEKNSGTVSFSFVYNIPWIPSGRIKRLSLLMAYSEDSLNHDQFFTSTNVSDAITKYDIVLPEGTYYFRATIMCLCQLDSCKYSGFSGQFGTRSTGNKFEVLKDQVTEVTTQFQ